MGNRVSSPGCLIRLAVACLEETLAHCVAASHAVVFKQALLGERRLPLGCLIRLP
jgi:hypothetical protein